MQIEEIKLSLEKLIEQTFKVEKEYKELKKAYNNLEKTIQNTIDFIPNPVWILEGDEVFLENEEARKNRKLFKNLRFDKKKYELELDNKVFLIKIREFEDKKIISATDITKAKKEARLISMGQMAAHLAHEVRNPIGSALILTSLLDGDSEVIIELKKALKRVERIVKSTLLFSKGFKINRVWVDTKEIIAEIDAAINYYSFQKRIEFIKKVEAERIFVDKELILIVFQNLVFNAIDAIEEDEKDSGRVEMILKEDRFIIYDSGVKIEDKKRIFEPFFSTKTKGNGLGLALVKEIIKAHKGKIEVIKEPKTFIVSWEKSS